MHNNETGPGQYNLPQLVFVEKRALSSMRNSPRMSIPVPKPNVKRGYHPENKNDYMGSSSPAPNKYNPNYKSVK